MARAFYSISVVVLCSLFLSGCVFILAGTVGALGGYAISNDTIQGETAHSFSELWTSAMQVLRIMGDIEAEDAVKGEIDAKIDASEVHILLEEVTSGVTRLKVTVRKYLLPNIRLAQKIYIKTIEHAQ